MIGFHHHQGPPGRGRGTQGMALRHKTYPKACRALELAALQDLQ